MSSAAERHRAADRGRGAAGAGQSRPGSPGRSWCWGQRSAMGPAPRSAGTNPAERHPRGRILVEAGGVPRRPLAAEPDRDRPRRRDTGGAGGAGAGAPGPRSPEVVGRRGGDRAGPRAAAAAGEGGCGRAGLARGRNPRGTRGLGEGSRGRPFPGGGGGGGGLPARGMTGAPHQGGGGRACGAVCRAMSIHGRAAWDYIPNPLRRSPFFVGGGGGGWGGGGGGCCEPPPMGGGVRRWELCPAWPKNLVASPGPWAPSRTNLGFAGGDSAIWYGMVWYGMVWYGMVWYGMVWYGMVWYGMVWYGMVWYGMVWYGMVWYGMVWYGMVWYGMLLLLLLLLRHPARAGGRNCQTRSPWGGRKGAVGRCYAGRAGADDDRGGGGGCVLAWRRVGPPVDVTLEPSPAAGGRVTRPV